MYNPNMPTQTNLMDDMIFKGEVNTCIKCKVLLNNNLQKLYVLILGQCSKSMEAKLKQAATWHTVLQAQDSMALLKLIKTVNYKFEE